jgi:hypothetical protein
VPVPEAQLRVPRGLRLLDPRKVGRTSNDAVDTGPEEVKYIVADSPLGGSSKL